MITYKTSEKVNIIEAVDGVNFKVNGITYNIKIIDEGIVVQKSSVKTKPICVEPVTNKVIIIS